MAAGMTVLSGIVLVPLIAVGTWYSHRKAGEVDAETVKLAGKMGELRDRRSQLVDMSQRAREHKQKLNTATIDLELQIAEIRRRLFPLWFVSATIRRIRSWLGGKYYIDIEGPILSELDRRLVDTARLFGAT